MVNALGSVRRARPLLGTFVEITAAGGEVRRLERAVDCAFDAVERVQRLMSYHERESDVSRPQFIGKRSGSTLELNKDIRNISRATLSSRHATLGVKKVLALYEVRLK